MCTRFVYALCACVLGTASTSVCADGRVTAVLETVSVGTEHSLGLQCVFFQLKKPQPGCTTLSAAFPEQHRLIPAMLEMALHTTKGLLFQVPTCLSL